MRVSTVGVNEHLFVIAPDRVEPGLPQKLESDEHARAAINTVANRNQPVDRPVEAERLEAFVKLSGFEVNVIHHKVTASLVLGEF